MSWVKCSERMPPVPSDPENAPSYLTYPHFAIMQWFAGGWFHHWDDEHDMWIPPRWQVTHWTELPEPPPPGGATR